MSSPPTPGPGTDCSNHRGRAAITYCSQCYRPICAECTDPTWPDTLCRQCSVSGILADVKAEVSAKTARKKSCALDDTRHRQDKRVKIYALAAVIVSTLAMLAVTAFPGLRLQGHALYASGLPAIEAPGLDGCVRQLWRVRKALSDYTETNGRLPQALSEALDGEQPVCPTCGLAYTYRRIDDTHYLVYCPRPNEHLVGSVRINSGSAPAVLNKP